MKTIKKQNDTNLKVSIRPKEWSKEELANVKTAAKVHNASRTPERKLKNQMLSIKYRMEDYISNEKINAKNIISLENFLTEYLVVMNLTLKRFAFFIDTSDGNLKKYLSGDRKFSTDLAFKFSSFFHTTPDLWLKVNMKNELISLKKEKKQISRYKKYDYKKILAH